MRVAVTTTADSFERVAAFFHAASLDPVEAPCIAIRPEAPDILASVRSMAEDVGTVMISSARTIAILWGSTVPPLSFITVGPVSTQTVRAAGGHVVLEGTSGLAGVMDQLDSIESRIVFPHGSGTDTDLIAAATPEIISRQVYRTESIDPPNDRVDAIVFASPSAVDGWFRTRDVSGLVVAAIGETTAQRLQQLGVTADVVPESPRFGELARGLAAYGGVKT